MSDMQNQPVKDAYDVWHSRRAVAGVDAALQPWHQTVLKLLPDLSGLSVLEVGCGSGAFSFFLAQKYPAAQITAVDFSPAAIGVATERQAREGGSIRFFVEDAQEMTLTGAQFDFVISCECLEHVPEPAKMAHEICRVLKPGGRFILTTENYFNGMILAWLVAWWRNKQFDSGSGAQPHENFFLFWRVKQILERAGMNLTHMESNYFQWLLLPRCAPHRLCTKDFNRPALKRLFRPFGRHFTFEGAKA